MLPNGPVSVALDSPLFHPYYENRPSYVKEEAYDNGMIWFWTFGQVIRTLSSFRLTEVSWTLTEDLIDQMNNRGVAGALAEFAAPFAKKGIPKLRGAQVHAMALAEFIRNFYEDYLGVYPDAANNTLYLIPSLPEKLSDVEFIQRIGGQFVKIKYQYNNLVHRVFIEPGEIFLGLHIALSLMNRSNANYQIAVKLEPHDKLLVEIPTYSQKLSDLKLSRNGVIEQTRAQIYIDPVENRQLYKQIQFAQPVIPKYFQSDSLYDFELLSNGELNAKSDSTELIISEFDKPKDEIYSYPANRAFANGILDIESLQISGDSLNYYFELKYRNLVDPGWHPEYGFQLTFTSILIQSPDFPEYRLEPAYNSKYTLEEARKFNREIVIGGGLEIIDGAGKIIAAYLPEEDDHISPLGDTKRNSISFSINRKLTGEINPSTRITVLVGAQQDFGGAGIGKFREVHKIASEWYGGGKANSAAHNIYDFLFIN